MPHGTIFRTGKSAKPFISQTQLLPLFNQQTNERYIRKYIS